MGWHGDVDGMGGHRLGLGTSGQPAFWVLYGLYRLAFVVCTIASLFWKAWQAGRRVRELTD